MSTFVALVLYAIILPWLDPKLTAGQIVMILALSWAIHRWLSRSFWR